MPSACVFKFACIDVQHAIQGSHKLCGFLEPGDMFVYATQDISWRDNITIRFSDDQSVSSRHKYCRRHALIGNIANEHPKFAMVEWEDIVEITTNLPGRKDASTKIEALDERKGVGENRHLDFGGDFQFPFEALFFDQLFLRGFELVKRLLKLTILLGQITERRNIRIIQTLAKNMHHRACQLR